MDISFYIFVLCILAVILLAVVLDETASKNADKAFELADVSFYHAILKSKDVYIHAQSNEPGSLTFIDKMTFNEIHLDVTLDLYEKLRVDESYNLTLKGKKIIDIREEDF